MVPLAEAWGAGAQAWSPEQRRDFANDMALNVALEAVTDEVNQSKSDRDPAEWMPSLSGTACGYATDWVLVKYRWQLTVDPMEHAALSSTMSGDCGARTVTVPAVAIAAPAPPPAPTPVSFSDVDVRNQFYNEISWLAAQGISTGWIEPDGSRTYRPLSPVNRDAMAAFMYRLAGKAEFTPPAVSPFRDVPVGTQFYKEITWLARQGITTGYDDGTYRPLQPVNRDAMAAFLYRFAGNPAYQAPAVSPFYDVAPGTQFYQQISWLASKGISTGFPLGSGCYVFDPLRPVARDAMAAFMYRFVNGGTPPPSGGGCTPTQPPPPAPGPAPTPVPPPPPSRPANPGDTRNCTGSTGFSTWREAQNWFEYYYPYYGDVARLDGNGDGIACEGLPGAP